MFIINSFCTYNMYARMWNIKFLWHDRVIHLNPVHSFIEDLVSTTRIDQDTSTCRAATIIAKKQTDMVNHTFLSRPVFAGAELDFLGGLSRTGTSKPFRFYAWENKPRDLIYLAYFKSPVFEAKYSPGEIVTVLAAFKNCCFMPLFSHKILETKNN